ncbi:MAG TPA: phosphatidate cytidylyltransferase [Longimicrobium sp.]|nr:phosphatidate cytidylyltransferase [Longimicrobium sp.]
MARNETVTRTLVAAAGIPVAVAAMYVGGWALAALLAAASTLAALEFFRMAEVREVRAVSVLGAGGAVALVAAAAAAPERGTENPALFGIVAVMVLAGCTAAIWMRGVAGQPLLAVSVTVFGAVYTSLLGFALFLRHLPGIDGALHGTALLLAPVLLTWLNDSFAYFGGRAWGRHKLIPRVSPGKTREGAACALVGTLVSAVVYSFFLADFSTYRIGIGEAALFGVLVSVFAQVGDLAESLFKRDVGVKDSGTLLPGHGGALDRFDSLFFTLPLAYAFFRYVVGA